MSNEIKENKLKELNQKEKKDKRKVLITRIIAVAMIIGTIFPIAMQIYASVSAGL